MFLCSLWCCLTSRIIRHQKHRRTSEPVEKVTCCVRGCRTKYCDNIVVPSCFFCVQGAVLSVDFSSVASRVLFCPCDNATRSLSIALLLTLCRVHSVCSHACITETLSHVEQSDHMTVYCLVYKNIVQAVTCRVTVQVRSCAVGQVERVDSFCTAQSTGTIRLMYRSLKGQSWMMANKAPVPCPLNLV